MKKSSVVRSFNKRVYNERRDDVTGPASTLSPRDVFGLIQRSALTGDGNLGDYYADDAVHEWPFPFPGASRRLSGRAEIQAWRARMRAGGSARFRFERFDNVVVHDTADPEVIVAEYDIHGTVTAIGRPFVFSYVLVLRVRDGKIVHLRDYLNPLAMTRAADAPAAAGTGDPVPAVPPGHADLLARPLFARVATVRPDGAPHNSVMWFAWDGTCLKLAHSRRGQKFRNVSADPRISVSLADPDNPYRSLEVRGVVTSVADDHGGAFLAGLARRYGRDLPPLSSTEDRVVLSVRPLSYATAGPAAKPQTPAET
jgi:PPOX class probable F420-dependent enzyme